MRWLLLSTWLAASSAIAQNVSVPVFWTNPTTYVDGTTFPASDFKAVQINYGICPDGKTMPANPSVMTVSEQVSPLVTTATVSELQNSPATGTPITYCFTLQVLGMAATDVPSPPTNVLTWTSPPPPILSPPSGVSVGTENTVYMEVRGQDKFTLVGVGTAPAGTACDATQDVDGYYVVPNADVTWAGNVRPPVVVAKCQ